MENWQWVNTTGLALDMVGAWLVANEVTSKFKGNQYIAMPIQAGGNTGPCPTDEFESWEKLHYIKLRAGVICLLAGFLIQIVSVWLQ